MSGEDGYELWLRYRKVEDVARLAQYRAALSVPAVLGSSPTTTIIRCELACALPALLDASVPLTEKIPNGNALVVGTIDELKAAGVTLPLAEPGAVGAEGFRLIPDFGGFQVKANSEGRSGPQDYGANHHDGAIVLADALAPFGGIVLRSSRGSNAVTQYRSPLRERFDDLDSCPEELLLWFHHVPWDHRLRSGRTLWQELRERYDDGVRFVNAMCNTWHDLGDRIAGSARSRAPHARQPAARATSRKRPAVASNLYRLFWSVRPMRPLALLFDLGDTIMVEETEVKDAKGTTLAAELVPGMAETLRAFKAAGYRLAIVADSRPDTPSNVLRQHGLDDLFEALAISGVTGVSKPDPGLFQAALDALGIAPENYGRVVMVGNNLERDIAGANRLGLISVFYHLNDRRRTQPLTPDEIPCHTVTSAAELRDLFAR